MTQKIQGHDVIGHVSIRIPIGHFLLVVHWTQVSISNRCRDNGPQIYWGHDLDLSGSRDVISHHVCVMGVIISVSTSLWESRPARLEGLLCGLRLRQLRRVRKSLDRESATTLVHAFVTSRVDYCNAVYAMSPLAIINRLQSHERSRPSYQ